MAIVADYRNLSVIVPAFNEEGGVQQTLEALKKNLPNAEIILVDDCSTDNTPNIWHFLIAGSGAPIKFSEKSRPLMPGLAQKDFVKLDKYIKK